MSRILALVLLIICFSNSTANAQSDTTYLYYNELGQPATKNTASTYYKVVKVGEVYDAKLYKVKGNLLKEEGAYYDKDLKKPHGNFKVYRDNGSLNYTAVYENGEPRNKLYYYENGKKQATIFYDTKGVITEQKGWDENGKEIKDYIAEKEAKFKGGPEGWKRYLEKRLNANVAADAGAPAGMYTVRVKFIVDKEGNISDVKADSIPAKCKACAWEGVRVIRDGPQWEPAVQNNRPVIYQAIQYITFQVVEETRKGKKNQKAE